MKVEMKETNMVYGEKYKNCSQYKSQNITRSNESERHR